MVPLVFLVGGFFGCWSGGDHFYVLVVLELVWVVCCCDVSTAVVAAVASVCDLGRCV